MRLRRKGDDVEVDNQQLTARVRGALVRVTDPDLLDGAADLARWLRGHPTFKEGHYGYWPIALLDGVVWERDDALERWVKGADRAVRTHELQEQACWDLASDFEPPHASATAVVAPGSLGRERLELVRYEYLAPQSGWFVGGSDGECVPLHLVV